jgi:hypothetical protein
MTTIEFIQGTLGFLGFINSIYLIGIITCISRLLYHRSERTINETVGIKQETIEFIIHTVLIAIIYSLVYFTLYFIFV